MKRIPVLILGCLALNGCSLLWQVHTFDTHPYCREKERVCAKSEELRNLSGEKNPYGLQQLEQDCAAWTRSCWSTVQDAGND